MPITCALPLAHLARPGTADRPIAVVGYPGERPRVGLLGGDVTPLPPSVRLDYGGLPRVLGAVVDLGAHERVPE
ncbi:uncharacterized protein SOCE26_041370 [Sorangium cellulosum]|uniref:Uncharacterized protein n=1 Tax=Sorangium cellulosum TaxID=56 RepID=A0A2L0ETV0_SORCE|nr:hypothetical protein [Sorangium cellulosum]AUX42704.1 uncharacterized protein SOCE26_041370 [Sorangium cellulosum]